MVPEQRGFAKACEKEPSGANVICLNCTSRGRTVAPRAPVCHAAVYLGSVPIAHM
jgi:hypothetical protein